MRGCHSSAQWTVMCSIHAMADTCSVRLCVHWVVVLRLDKWLSIYYFVHSTYKDVCTSIHVSVSVCVCVSLCCTEMLPGVCDV